MSTRQLLRSVFFVLIGSLFFSLAVVVQAADCRLNVQYSLSDVTMTATGTKVTLDMAVTNTGDSALNNTTIVMMDPLKIAAPHKQTLSISSLSAGETSTRAWTVSTIAPEPREKISADLRNRMVLEVSAVDQNGNTVRPMTIIKPYVQ